MDMDETLRLAAAKLGERTKFDARQVFGKRVGKQIVFPIGLGSALAKAVREGYLTVVRDGDRRRGRTYEFTAKGAPLFGAAGPRVG